MDKFLKKDKMRLVVEQIELVQKRYKFMSPVSPVFHTVVTESWSQR